MAEQRQEEDYIKALEDALSGFLKPFKDIPFPVVIKALTGTRVLAYDPSNGELRELLDRMSKATSLAGREANETGIFTARPNEAGNQIEPFVVSALRQCGVKSIKPVSRKGRTKTAGYPDIEATYKELPMYIDCKTFAGETRDSTLRTFYLSPSDDPKVTRDAYHLLIAYQMERDTRRGKEAFVPTSWHIYSLHELKVQVKHEFNASNRDLYHTLTPLAEGSVD